MSGDAAGRRAAPAEVTSWLAHSFDDFFGNTNTSSTVPGKALEGGAGTNRLQKKQALSSLPTSGKDKDLPRKRAKSSSVDSSGSRSRQNQSQSQDEPWVDKYKPETQNDLAVHKKKIEEVEAWLKMHIFQRKPKQETRLSAFSASPFSQNTQQGSSILLLTGPAGCGKTATVQILVKDLGIQVQEWTNPTTLDFTKEDIKSIFGHDSNFHTYPSQAQAALFQDFILRANKYNKLQMLGESSENDKKLILIEDVPNQFYRDPSSLHEILRRFVRTSRCPLIFIISDNFSGDSNQRLLFPKEILEELCISNISFNPVAPTNMMRVLNRIATIEATMNREKNYAPDKTSLESICRGCSGDIRSAINSLQFSSMKVFQSRYIEMLEDGMKVSRGLWNTFVKSGLLLALEYLDYSFDCSFRSRKKGTSTLKCETGISKARKKNKTDNLENEEIQAIGGKDASIFLFHALGKIIYCKRERLSESEFPQLPSHLSEFRRDALLIQPEEIVEKSHMSGSMFNLYLHQNYVEFFANIDDVVRASEYLSIADVLCSNWNSRPMMEKYSASVATRGVIHSNTGRAFAQSQGGMGFRPLHKPQWFFISKKYQENCLAAKSLFSNFCLPPECLQTELLPYLAMLTNPMRNQAQIAFIQDVGRLPLKRHFGRLKLETLTDKDPGIPDLFVDYEGDLAATNAMETTVQAEQNKTNENGSDGFPLSSSQCSGNELPCSQPQPTAAQAIMEEDELKIEEYDTD